MSHFHHERLNVYQKAIALVSDIHFLVASVPKKIAARDQLDRAAISIPINIAEANSANTTTAAIHQLEIAIGSALESAAAIDVLIARQAICPDDASSLRLAFYEIVGMLYGLRRSKSSPAMVRENSLDYQSGAPPCFDHEKLRVYVAALKAVELFGALGDSVSASLLKSIDRASTSVVLNIAEGNGRFGNKDRARFLAIAKRSLLQVAAVWDVARAREEIEIDLVEQIKEVY